MKIIAIISRTLLGLVFIFSGFVKAIDPLGSAYKFMDYFAVFNMQWLDSFAIILGVLLAAMEFLIGMALLFGLKNKISAWGGLLFMVFFTPLTLYIALKDPVPDCGCFGDAIIMTNWETFYKNIILIIFAIINFAYRNKLKNLFCCKVEWALISVFFLLSCFVSYYGYTNLPIIDFRDWKVGSSMKIDPDEKDKFYVIYKNKETGEIKEYLSPNFPWNDTAWVATWEYIDQRIEPAPLPDNYIFINDKNGDNYSRMLTQNPDFQFLLLMYDIETSKLKDKSNIEKVKLFAEKSFDQGIDFAAIVANSPEVASKFIEDNDINFEIYFSDDITLKTVVRANPGLVLIKEATILAKWHFNNFPELEKIEFQELENKYLINN